MQYSGLANGEITVWSFTVVEGFKEEQAFEKGPYRMRKNSQGESTSGERGQDGRAP